MHDFPDFDMLDALIASALKKLLNTQTHFRKRVKCRRAASSKTRPILTRKTDCVQIYEYFRATGACEAVQGLSNLFAFSLQNDDVQDFDVRWDHALLSVSEMPTDMILEDCTSQNSRTLLNFRLCWLCTIKKRREARSRSINKWSQL